MKRSNGFYPLLISLSVSKMTLNGTPKFLNFLTFGLNYGTQRVYGYGCRCTTCKREIVDGVLLLDVPAKWIEPTVRGLIDGLVKSWVMCTVC